MAVSANSVVEQIDELLALYDAAQGNQRGPWIELKTRLSAAIERLAPAGSVYLEDMRSTRHPNTVTYVSTYARILRALRADYAAGYMRSVEELIHADVFDDFLSMCEELLRGGYFVPAAVLAGSAVEGHFHKLADKHGVSLMDANGRPKSMEMLGVELRKEDVISEPERKIVQGWYAQRTEAAHGRPENVIEQQVQSMVPGIRDFMVRHPA